MKITANEQTIEASGLGQTANFGIKNSAAAFQLLSSGLYTNKIRAVLREIGCNAVDAHALNGNQKTPIEVKLPNRLDNQFYIRDFGPGLSHDQIMKLYTTYFDSTKQASDDFIGGFGVGSKSPFAYTDTFTVVSRHKGTEYVYAAFVNDEGMPTIAAMSEGVATQEADGLMVGFPVRPEDFNAFEKEAREVFSAFKVPPTVLGLNLRLDEFKSIPIIEGVAALARRSDEYRYNAQAQLNMGGVRYPLSAFAEKLENSNQTLSPQAKWLYHQNVELDVPIGSVSVAASREALQYDKKTMANIPQIVHNAAVRCLTTLKNTLDAIPADKPPVERAKLLAGALEGQKRLAWSSLPDDAMKELFPNRDDFMACQMALTERYTVDVKDFPALHVWKMNGSFHSRMQEYARKGVNIDTFEGRRKIQTSFKRNWNQASANDSYNHVVFGHTSHSLMPQTDGPANPVRKPDAIQLSLDKTLPVLESNKPMTVDSLLENHHTQSGVDHQSIYSRSYVVSPVIHYKDGKPRALTPEEMQEFETQKAAFFKQYGIQPKPLEELNAVVAPVKNKVLPAVWTVPLSTRDMSALKKTLRGIPSSDYGVAHRTVSNEAKAYVLYDRKASQANIGTMAATDLAVQANKYDDFLQSSYLLEKHGVPTDVQLLDKKDLAAFKALYPNARSFSKYLADLRNDPVIIAQAQTWENNRPKLMHMDSYARQWMDFAENMPDLAPDCLLAQTVAQWKTHATSASDEYAQDVRNRTFYGQLFSKDYPEAPVVDTMSAVRKLQETYPYIGHFNYNTPTAVKHGYIADVNTRNGWLPKPDAQNADAAPSPYGL